MEDFLKDLRNDHSDFDKAVLSDVMGTNPFVVFNQWLKNAADHACPEVNSCVISTVDDQGKPSARVVYLKEVLNDEFIFYTNYNSHKGQDLANNPHVSMLFFWPSLQQQVRIEGVAKKVASEMSDDYFQSRPRASKVGAWASNQSEELSSREELEERVHFFADKYKEEVPRPPHWGGYAIEATRVEFWQGRNSRLHDRFTFIKENNTWRIARLNP